MELNYDREHAKDILAMALTTDLDATSNDTPFLTSTLQMFENAVLAKTPSSNTH
ncbi:hypothetical protein AGABI1DRAFT_126931 [Agaricus bisporus var. burnettii JB137-S8]|uniref:Uncharacterized protein n=1 Tax=Agaricus bisporus var. burnettii (strain JB137-S8 / ATCC MYA-4627 / FGSC 10392) TaxID=597362 RepID=K5XCM9_AGABU|nr:uncharacterized protein AGABI1DRAFT_126931 [Agaricus bisporus var. burnettii JB137-S8]EKM80877.1 hypothetical protein AGABI1DRAFT_126931 [Agaricus bisporus var. burnettii JB137-S8]